MQNNPESTKRLMLESGNQLLRTVQYQETIILSERNSALMHVCAMFVAAKAIFSNFATACTQGLKQKLRANAPVCAHVKNQILV